MDYQQKLCTTEFMGVKMAKLSNFTINSTYPAAIKNGSTSGTITFPSRSIGSGGSYFVTQNITVASGQIVTPAIKVGNTTYPTSAYSNQTNQWIEQIWIERTSATNVQVVFYVANIGSGTATHSSATATVYINTFTMP